jgi:hypothetical protein
MRSIQKKPPKKAPGALNMPGLRRASGTAAVCRASERLSFASEEDVRGCASAVSARGGANPTRRADAEREGGEARNAIVRILIPFARFSRIASAGPRHNLAEIPLRGFSKPRDCTATAAAANTRRRTPTHTRPRNSRIANQMGCAMTIAAQDLSRIAPQMMGCATAHVSPQLGRLVEVGGPLSTGGASAARTHGSRLARGGGARVRGGGGDRAHAVGHTPESNILPNPLFCICCCGDMAVWFQLMRKWWTSDGALADGKPTVSGTGAILQKCSTWCTPRWCAAVPETCPLVHFSAQPEHLLRDEVDGGFRDRTLRTPQNGCLRLR